ncbi:MAG: Lysine decarboxylase family [uncultured Paraburkholderia sp.]|nr:MAG: Lysine decarboxylase family [uncultured Paraburkholderia sp.]
MKSVCVYCGSSNGVKPLYAEAAPRAFGRALVYGGGKVGLMGVIADTVMARRRPRDRRDSAAARQQGSRP